MTELLETRAIGSRPHVVIVGAGFGGLNCAQALGGAPVRVTVIDRNNYHLFVPLLYQVATAALSPADIARPIRRILARHQNIDVMLAEVVGIDIGEQTLRFADGRTFGYDRLVLATGSQYAYFGHDEWAELAPGPRSLDDARTIRTRLLSAFERAEISDDPAEQDALMTTIIVGGGPTGVETAGAVAELARHALARDFRRIDPRRARILLLEAGPRILAAFPAPLAQYAHHALERLGVTILTEQAVETIESAGGMLRALAGGQRMRAGTIVWGAGVAASPAARWLGVPLDRAGRIPVAADLSVPDCPGVYALGDIALSKDESGAPLPALAQVATQQGEHLGRALHDQLTNGATMPPFRFNNRGNTAIIGRHSAIFDFGRRQLKGRAAWLLWALVHVYLLVGFDNRLRVCLQWLWRYLTYERGARLITPQGRATKPAR